MVNFKHFDYPLLITIFLLLSLSLIIQYSLSAASGDLFFTKQFFFILFGLVLFFLVSLLDYRTLGSYAYIFYLLILIFLLGVLFFGQTFRGTRGWFFLPFLDIYFQPVEIAKLALIIVLAKFWSERDPSTFGLKTTLGVILLFLPLLILAFAQPDFGSAFLLIILGLGMLFIFSGFLPFWGRKAYVYETPVPFRPILGIILGFLLIFALAFLSWSFLLKDYQKERVFTYLNPRRDPSGRGYQITQATIAIGSGGFFGRGLGLGPQSQLHFLPEARTDFVFSVLGEELGFLGLLFLLGLYIFLFYHIFQIAKSTYDNFGLFLVLGIALLFLSQIFINISVNLGLLPITGISLPFLSYGGSALVVNLIATGILQSVVKCRVK